MDSITEDDCVAYMGGAKTSEEKGHKRFKQDFGGDVFIITPKNGTVSRKWNSASKPIMIDSWLYLKGTTIFNF